MNAASLSRPDGARAVRWTLAGAIALASGAAFGQTGGAVPGAPAPTRAVEGVGATLLDLSLELRPGRVVSMDERIVVFVDDRARRREISTGDLLAIIPTPGAASFEQRSPAPSGAAGPAPSIVINSLDTEEGASRPAEESEGLLRLTDNQRYTGDLAAPESGASEDRLAWRHGTFGQRTFAFDEVSAFRRPGVDPTALPGAGPTRSGRSVPSQDLLLLANGDLLQGFLAGLSDPARFESDQGMVEVEFPLVRGAVLANPDTPPQGVRVWLADGAVVHAIALELDPRRRLTITLSDGRQGAFDWESVLAVLFDAAKLTPLAAAPIRSQEALGDRHYAPPIYPSAPNDPRARWPAFDAWDLVVPGPMAAEFELPMNAARLGTRVELTDPRSPWGDCEIVFLLDGREVFRRRLSAADPGVDVTLDLAGGAILGLRLEPGAYGAIKDSVTLRRPLILVAEER